jgi:single-strand DNA-binding protein
MANGLNRASVLGNLGADPELRFTSSGSAVLKMRIATADSYLDANKQRQERTEWHSIVIWGKRAEALARILAKGSRVYVDGQLRTSSWEDKDGIRRYRTEIVASELILAGGGRGPAAPGPAPAEPEVGGYDVPIDELGAPPASAEDEIPF